MRFPGHLQFRPQRVAGALMHRFIRERHAKLLAQPLPNRFVPAKALRLGEALLEGLPYRLGEQRRFAWRLGNRQQLGNAAARLGGQPASHGIAIDTPQLRHLTAGAGLLGLEGGEGLQALLSLGIARGMEAPPQLFRRFVDRGNGRFHGNRLRPSRTSA